MSDLARDAVHRLIGKDSQADVESAMRALEGRIDTLDLQVQRLNVAVGQPPVERMRQANGKA